MEEEYAFLKLLLTEPLFLAPPDAHAEGVESYSYRGGYAKHILVLLHKEASADEEAFLLKVLQSVKLYPEDVAIVAASDYPPGQLQALIAHFTPKQILLFGDIPGLPSIPAYVPRQSLLGSPALGADSLPAVAQDTEKKKLLWNALKALF